MRDDQKANKIFRRRALGGALVLGLVAVAVAPRAVAQVRREPPGPPVRDYEIHLQRIEAGAAEARLDRADSVRPTILLVGYWPPTNDMIRPFSDNLAQNPDGWIGADWGGRGYDIFSFFPEFPNGPGAPSPSCAWGPGVGDFEVDYQDTSADWHAITEQIKPLAIVTFSRGFPTSGWEIEFVQRNLETWFGDFRTPDQPTPAPPETGAAPGHQRCSSLPAETIVDALDAVASPLTPNIDFDGYGGGFLSEFLAYHGAWYQGAHGSALDPHRTLAAGHVHVGFDACQVDLAPYYEAVAQTLQALIAHLDGFDAQAVGDRCPGCCLGTPSGTSASDEHLDFDVSCEFTSQACCRGAAEPLRLVCTNHESFDVQVEWSLCNDPTNCRVDDATDVAFTTLDPQPCGATGCGLGSVQGANCGCARGGSLPVPAGETVDVFEEVQCPAWSPVSYACGSDSCCECQQELEDECALRSETVAEPGLSACLRLDWFASSATSPGQRRMRTQSMTVAGCPQDADAPGPGQPAFPLITVHPPFSAVTGASSTVVTLQVTNPARNVRQFDFILESVNPAGGPKRLALTPLTGVATSVGNGSAQVLGRLVAIPAGQALGVAVRIDGMLLGGTFDNELRVIVSDPLSFSGVPVSALISQKAPPIAGAGEASRLHVRKLAGGDLRLEWSPSCLSTDADYAVYEGQLGAFTSHVAVTCSTDGLASRTLSPIDGDAYYLVVPTNSPVEGSYGLDGEGEERPPSVFACRSQSLAGCP